MEKKVVWRWLCDGLESLARNASHNEHKMEPSLTKQRMDTLSWMDKLGLTVDTHTYASLLTRHCQHRSLQKGKLTHDHIVRHGQDQNCYLSNLLVLMYGKCGAFNDARAVFVHMPDKNAFSCNIMVGVCLHNHQFQEAIHVFKQMSSHDLKPDKVTFISILSVCAHLATLSEGVNVHETIVAAGVEIDIPLGTALLNMYGRCGTLMQAREVFDQMQQRNVIAWSAMVTVYGQHGDGNMAVTLFYEMGKNGIAPCEVAFVCVLSACSRTGLVDEGLNLFLSMVKNHRIRPTEEHYNCMIDLLGRAGRLSEGEALMKSFRPSILSWITLLGACRMKLDLKRAAWVADRVFELDSGNPISRKMLRLIHLAAKEDVDVSGLVNV